MEITAKMVKDLREATGAGPLDCKKALEENNGDVQKAIQFLREKGLARASKKLGAGRSMNEGVVQSYVHFNKRIGVLVEVNCETDFVANTAQFQQLASDIALHIANLAPQVVRREEVPTELIENERHIQMKLLKEDPKNANKPAEILERIIEGRMDKFYEEIVLMEQAFLKDDTKKISDVLKEVVASVGESIEIRRFARFALGEAGDASENGADA